MDLLYPAISIKTNTPLTRYYQAAVINTLILGKSAREPEADMLKAIFRDGVWRALARIILLPALGRNLLY